MEPVSSAAQAVAFATDGDVIVRKVFAGGGL
jgi:hypothetical protein